MELTGGEAASYRISVAKEISCILFTLKKNATIHRELEILRVNTYRGGGPAYVPDVWPSGSPVHRCNEPNDFCPFGGN